MAEIVAERLVGPTKRAVVAGLGAFNRARTRDHSHKRFAMSLREADEIVGGVTGEMWMGVLFIQLFWIDEAHRGRGNGARLLAAIEARARHFGAIHAFVDTMSFQAPDFYRKCGYVEFGAIGGYPDGITRHWFEKRLAPLDPSE
ncbi:NAT_SF domain containing protein [Rhabdaerophilaceae bacterium]